MVEDLKLEKFQNIIIDLMESICDICSVKNSVNYKASMRNNIYGNYNTILKIIFDYNFLNNDYAKIIIDNTVVLDSGNYYKTRSYLRNNDRSNAMKSFLIETHKNNICFNLFWALLILSVDRTDYQSKLSNVCDFFQLFNITDIEVRIYLDLIKILFCNYHDDIIEVNIKEEDNNSIRVSYNDNTYYIDTSSNTLSTNVLVTKVVKRPLQLLKKYANKKSIIVKLNGDEKILI